MALPADPGTRKKVGQAQGLSDFLYQALDRAGIRIGIPDEGLLAGKPPRRALNVTGWASEIHLQVLDLRHAEVFALQGLDDGVQHLFGCAGG